MTSDPDAFVQGLEAFMVGEPETANPYDLDENEAAHMAWNDGWREGSENEDKAEGADA